MKSKLYVPVLLDILDDTTKNQVSADLKAAGADAVLLCFCEVFARGQAQEAKLAQLLRMKNFLESQGFPVTVWISTLGYAGRRNQDFQEQFADCEHIRDFDGGDKGDVICLLDRKYRDFTFDFICQLGERGCREILLDDDFTLSGRDIVTCTCPLHLQNFAEVTGRTCTREEIREAFTGIPNALRTNWLDAQAATIRDYCTALRAEVDRRCGRQVRIGLCATSTGFDLESPYIEELVKILAGDNRPRLRLAGAPYWGRCGRFASEGKVLLSGVTEYIRSQRQWLQGADLELNYEGDPHPRNTLLVPAADLEHYDKMLLAAGGIQRQKYLMYYDRNRELAELGYLQAHCANRKDDEFIERIFASRRCGGFRIHHFRSLIRGAVLPRPYLSNEYLIHNSAANLAGTFAQENSVPTAYEGRQPGIAFWENARYLTEADCRAGVVLDITAAGILTERGIDVGLKKAEPVPLPVKEFFCDNPAAAQACWDPDAKVYRMTIAPGAELSSVWRLASGEEIPACYTYENKDGMRFAVYGFDASTVQLYNPMLARQAGRQRQLVQLYRYLSGGGTLPAVCLPHPRLYTMAAQGPDGSLALLLCNHFDDAVRQPVIELNGEYRVAAATVPEYAGLETRGGKLTLPAMIPAYSYLALELEPKK